MWMKAYPSMDGEWMNQSGLYYSTPLNTSNLTRFLYVALASSHPGVPIPTPHAKWGSWEGKWGSQLMWGTTASQAVDTSARRTRFRAWACLGGRTKYCSESPNESIHGLEKSSEHQGTSPATCFHTPSSSLSLTQLWVTGRDRSSCSRPLLSSPLPRPLIPLSSPSPPFSSDFYSLALQVTECVLKMGWMDKHTTLKYQNIPI